MQVLGNCAPCAFADFSWNNIFSKSLTYVTNNTSKDTAIGREKLKVPTDPIKEGDFRTALIIKNPIYLSLDGTIINVIVEIK